MKSTNGEARQAELIEIDLRQVLAGDPAANIALQPFDYLVIKEVPLWAVAGGSRDSRRSEVPRPLSDPPRRDAALGDGARRRPDRPGIRGRRGVHARGAEGARDASSSRRSPRAWSPTWRSSRCRRRRRPARTRARRSPSGKSLLASLRETQAGRPAGHRPEPVDDARPGSEQDIVLKDGDRCSCRASRRKSR